MKHYSFIILLVSALCSLFDQSFAMYKVSNEIVIEDSVTLTLKNNRLLQIINNINTNDLDQSLVTVKATLLKDKTNCSILVKSPSQTTMLFNIMINEANKKMMIYDSFRQAENFYIIDTSTQELIVSVEGDLTLGGVSFIKNKQPMLRNCSIITISGATKCSASEFFTPNKFNPKKIVPIKQNDEDIYRSDKVDKFLTAEQTSQNESIASPESTATSMPIASPDSNSTSKPAITLDSASIFNEEQKESTDHFSTVPVEQKPSLRTKIIRWFSGNYNKVEPGV